MSKSNKCGRNGIIRKLTILQLPNKTTDLDNIINENETRQVTA